MSAAFHALRVAEVRRETPDAVSLRLEPPEDAAAAFAFRAGQHLTVRAQIDGEEVRRNYSVCVAPHEGELRIAVKRIKGGAFSAWVNDALKAGDVLEAMQPHGSFTWTFEPEASRRYAAFVGGSGITPVLSLLKTALSVEAGSRFALFYGNRTAVQTMFLDEIAGLKNRWMDRLEVFHFLQDEEDADIAFLNGRMDASKVAEILRGPLDARQLDAAFVCGPGPMMDAVEAGLKAGGLAPDRIRIERFTPGEPAAPRAAAVRELADRAAGLPMTVVLDGRRSRVAFSAEQGDILSSVRAAGLPAPFACRAGVCATCRAKILEGRAEMQVNFGLTNTEVAEGYVLTCQAAPVGPGLLIDYDG